MTSAEPLRLTLKTPKIILVPEALRPRDHVEAILGLDDAARDVARRTDPISDAALQELKNIYGSSIRQLETIYKYQDISNRHMSDAEIFGPPLILLLGPYSTGKSTFLNYLMNLEFTRRALKTGANPSHGVFRIIQYGSEDMELDGTALSASNTFRSLQKFGQNFVDQLRGNVINVPLLKKVTFVEAPGILEMRRPGERQYPFNDVLQWFIDRADLVLAMFDYTKLDAGYELEAVLDQLKGREAQVRILLNKADQIPPEELIKVQGSLFWNLSPLLGVSAPPTVYAGSFSSKPYRTSSPAKLFQAQEEALFHDIARAINSRVENRVANARRHAVRVRNHAQMVDSYLTTYNKNKGFLTSKHKLAEDIVENPQAYNIYEGVSLLTNISRYDLPDPEIYRDFFRLHNLYDFPSLKSSCSYLHGCPLDQIDRAISSDMPDLLSRYRKLLTEAGVTPHLSQDANIFVERQPLTPTHGNKQF
ncbi:Dynamin superfamily [Trinorchestia longiramus]|nr:Dynamin superfamily [Trinorchestia longiramus]